MPHRARAHCGTHARTHSATVCVCLYRARTHTVPQTHTCNRTQYDQEAGNEDVHDEESFEGVESKYEGEVSGRLGCSARRSSLRALWPSVSPSVCPSNLCTCVQT